MNCRLLALLALLATAIGCENAGNESTGADAAAETRVQPWDASAIAGCDLLTDDEIQTVLGESLTAKEEGGYYGCRWTTESNLVNLSAFASTSLPADACTENQTSMPFGQSVRGRLQVVTGLGDKAIWGSSTDLHVCTARGLLRVKFERSASNLSPDARREATVLIAEHALARLN